ncbi:MAG: alginate lyase family protein [Candidatus Hinthialibacter antarcticus]|nr:alginate lyase family protein [Candidatus Hinthialibacter antarcticus]
MTKRIVVVLLLIFAFQIQTFTNEQIVFGESVFLTPSRIELIKERIEKKQEPQYTAFLSLKNFVSENKNRKPHAPNEWYVPGYYRDAEGHVKAKEGLQDDANTAYGFALYYQLTGDETYSEAAARLIDAWTQTVKTMSDKDDSTLSFSYHFPALIFAADLIKTSPRWPKKNQIQFNEFVRKKALPMNTMSRENNWGNWGLVLVMASASYLDDKPLFERGVNRWKEFIESQIAEDGHLPHEVTRSEGQRGIWYSHFSLMPQTIAAEIARVNGVDLYEYVSPNNRNLKSAYAKIAQWTLKPEEFPYYKGKPGDILGINYYGYFEILLPHWENKNARELIATNRPQTARHCTPFQTLTHGDISPEL